MRWFSRGIATVSYTHLDVYKRQEIDPEDTGARLGQDGSTVDVRPEDWKTLFRDGDEEKGGAR